MKKYARRVAAVTLAVALSLPLVAAESRQKQERDQQKSAIVQIVKRIQRVLGISTNDDLPLPPYPTQPPPPTTT
jgi:hypothetical protein